jgi:hypothetical protein
MAKFLKADIIKVNCHSSYQWNLETGTWEKKEKRNTIAKSRLELIVEGE